MKIKGDKKSPLFHTEEELREAYTKFEDVRIANFKKMIGREDAEIKPDPFPKFLLDRTNLCPHKLITPLSAYWVETINMFDGELGLTLPATVDNIPALFFDALSTVRRARSIVRTQEKKDKET